MRGTIKLVRLDRGFGFITPEEVGPDVFFHRSALVEGLTFGEGLRWRRVEFDTEVNAEGRIKAVSVRLAE